MKRFLCRCSLWVILFGLAAGIFCLFWSMRQDNLEERGTLVKNICERTRECLNL